MSRRFLLAFSGLWLLVPATGVTSAGPTTNRRTPLVEAIERVRPAVVNIHSEKKAPAPRVGFVSRSNKLSGMGTGVIVDQRGLIVTNFHVIENVSSIRATLVDGATYAAEVLARDPETDLALLRIRPPHSLPVMPMGNSEDLMYGETVVAIGNAFGYQHTITKGIISELHRDVRLSDEQMYRDLVQTDASINPGNSGGPLINADGEMIGLNVAIRAGAQGIGFAIPVNDVTRVLSRLMSVRRLNRTWHGMEYRQLDFADPGEGRIALRGTEPGSPAQRAGIVAGDRLIEVDGQPVRFAHDVERALLDAKPDDRVPLRLLRNGDEVHAYLVVRSAPVTALKSTNVVWRRLGLELAEGQNRDEVNQVSTQLHGGLRIMRVAANGVAGQAGLEKGDILVGLHIWETLTLKDIRFVLQQPMLSQSSSIRFFAVRDRRLLRGSLDLPLPR